MKIFYKNIGDGKHQFNITDDQGQNLFESSHFPSKSKCVGAMHSISNPETRNQLILEPDIDDPLSLIVKIAGEGAGRTRSLANQGEVEAVKTKFRSSQVFEAYVQRNGEDHIIEQEVDVEDCACRGVIPYIAFKYVIRINSKRYVVSQAEITGMEILALIGETPQTAFVRQKIKGQKEIIEPDQVVDLAECGVERFIVQKKSATEGLVSQGFILPENDQEYLAAIDNNSRTVRDGNNQWLIIEGLRIPDGYNVKTVDAALHIPSNYPEAQIDMIYFHPHLSRKDGQPIGALSSMNVEGKSYQRWSRHRTGANPWIPGEDDVSTHLDLMKHCLNDEFNKR